MKSPLLQAPLPVMRKPVPTTWISREYSGDPTPCLHIEGIGQHNIPQMVIDAVRELEDAGMWDAMGYECIGKMSQPGVEPRRDIALLALMLRYDEMNYVGFEKCN